ncbi:methionyl-tRNA formyltransferase [Candidatus Uhrbacteria bacterium RIFOXYB12_FULL_58_10]|uniref:Methionyl-tRNA formyltransferase n=1 Tax=Candidatus Uhrbacteria bacterium RIFOXYB2_FULL_57_15 TaxID=1802422 RepID=A0A1F7W6X1_9BACT|nr:MAG: methionyl-tRNA formyltransferase [Candidatus Uhrbacteria bacterium RIFOXYB12_FULL_58_10]OGL98520.1 MAG: methionyl-tRNA formyltransferase [Candidatus Uhrbacteria bacterium RIFOXYB2_FULL_57_15]
MRVVFFGTPSFSIPFLRALLEDPTFEVIATVTRPDEEAGRNHVLTAPPIKIAAAAAGIPTFQPTMLKSDDARETLRAMRADVFIVFAYGRIIPKAILDLPRFGCVNVHPSLLPKYRGPSPMQSAIQNGDAKTGISIMLLDEGMDTGPLLSSVNIGLDDNETIETLTKKVEEQGPGLLVETIKRLAAGEIVPMAQDNAQATICKSLDREDGHIDWNRSLAHIERMTRAYKGWPGTWTTWNGLRLKIQEVAEADFNADLPPGTVSVKHNQLFVDCADGTLEILTLQPEGKPKMTAEAFLRGYSTIDTAVLT